VFFGKKQWVALDPIRFLVNSETSMNVQVVHPQELTAEQINLWSGMMNSRDFTDSPFFHPEYVLTLSRFREPVRVGIVKENGRPVAFFPFERHGKSGRPLGFKLCDFQGVIRSPGTVVDARALLVGCGLTSWEFDHVVASHPEFLAWHLRVEDSPYLDLSQGFDAYVAQHKKAGHKSISRTNQKRRKMEREIGPIRFAWHSTDRAVFETLLEWQSDQRRRTGTFDILQFDWVVQTLDAIRQIEGDDFSGVLSTLHVNDSLAAVFLSMTTQTDLHQWFSAYNVALGRYSPGNILHLAMARAAAERGILRIDLGRGKEPYKKSFGSGNIFVAEGAVDLNPLRHGVRTGWYRTCEKIRNSRLHGPLQAPKRIVRGLIKRKLMRS